MIVTPLFCVHFCLIVSSFIFGNRMKTRDTSRKLGDGYKMDKATHFSFDCGLLSEF